MFSKKNINYNISNRDTKNVECFLDNSAYEAELKYASFDAI